MSSPRCKKKKILNVKEFFFLLIKIFFLFFFIIFFFFSIYLLLSLLLFFLMYVTNICRNYSTKQRVNAKLNCIFYRLSFNTCVVFCYYVGTHVTNAILNNFLTYTYLLYIHLPLAQ